MTKKKDKNQLPYISTDELEEAKLLWLRVNHLDIKFNNNFKNLENSLRLSLDDNGLYRSTGSLSQGKALAFSTKKPILLNRNHELTPLIVLDAHKTIKHSGERHTLTEVRYQYWIPRSKSFIKKILNKCVTCKKLNSRPYNYPISPDLLSVRLNDDVSFSGTGVDYSGVLYCKNLFNSNSIDEDDMYKCYIVIYTYESTSGVVLDLVPDASAEAFVNSLSKFISRRGCPQIILADNGSLFMADITQNFVVSKNVKWDFNLANAPWYGGFWERLIGQVKRCLKKVLGRTTLDFYQLKIVIQEIELILNSRPLGVLYDDDMEQILTPNHLLFGRNLNLENVRSNFNLESEVELKKCVNHNNILTHFWNRWRSVYVPSLREY